MKGISRKSIKLKKNKLSGDLNISKQLFFLMRRHYRIVCSSKISVSLSLSRARSIKITFWFSSIGSTNPAKPSKSRWDRLKHGIPSLWLRKRTKTSNKNWIKPNKTNCLFIVRWITNQRLLHYSHCNDGKRLPNRWIYISGNVHSCTCIELFLGFSRWPKQASNSRFIPYLIHYITPIVQKFRLISASHGPQKFHHSEVVYCMFQSQDEHVHISTAWMQLRWRTGSRKTWGHWNFSLWYDSPHTTGHFQQRNSWIFSSFTIVTSTFNFVCSICWTSSSF